MIFHTMDTATGERTFAKVAPGQILILELSQQDKLNIQNMVPTATLYSAFDDGEDRGAVSRAVEHLPQSLGHEPPAEETWIPEIAIGARRMPHLRTMALQAAAARGPISSTSTILGRAERFLAWLRNDDGGTGR